MKINRKIFCLLASALVLAFSGASCKKKQESARKNISKAKRMASSQKATMQEAAKHGTTSKKPTATTSSVAKKQKSSAVESVINYGTGSTHLKIKKNKTQQIKDMQKNYNDRLKKAMGQ